MRLPPGVPWPIKPPRPTSGGITWPPSIPKILFLVGVGKIGIRLIGILVLLAMSPLIILGLIVAFITVL